MCSGLPAVVPDAGGAAELAGEEWAARYKAGDPASCARATLAMLQRVRERGRERVAQSALRSAATLPTVDAHFESLYGIYEDLLASRGTRRRRGLSSGR
jgi:alpha-1,6-mannosyltransferase